MDNESLKLELKKLQDDIFHYRVQVGNELWLMEDKIIRMIRRMEEEHGIRDGIMKPLENNDTQENESAVHVVRFRDVYPGLFSWWRFVKSMFTGVYTLE